MELEGILKKHELWLAGDKAGKHADLRGANLVGTDLSGAKLTKNGETVKTANARCHPDDEFDFGIGAKLAVERLFAHEPEYFTGDVVCVEDPKEFYFTVGKIYHVENGSMSTGHYIISKLTSIDDLNARFNNVRFIELVK